MKDAGGSRSADDQAALGARRRNRKRPARHLPCLEPLIPNPQSLPSPLRPPPFAFLLHPSSFILPPSFQCRLMIDPPGAGAWNMAVDEMLLEWAAAQRGCCLRFYSWREATLSLGYFQEYRDRAGHGPSRKCPVVRRLTGGGYRLAAAPVFRARSTL